MREIKFRVWDIFKKEFYTGTFNIDKNGTPWADLQFEGYTDKSEDLILMQYTGLKELTIIVILSNLILI